MKILWLCNIVLPELCKEFGFKEGGSGGWITGMWEELKRISDLSLGICVPILSLERMKDGEYCNYNYYSFQMISDETALNALEERFSVVLKEFEPEVVHIWGTEYLHSYAMVKACINNKMIERVLVNVQGLVSVIRTHYSFGLHPETLAAKVNGKSIYDEIEDFGRRGNYEVDLLKKVIYISGRTEWDKACVKRINHKLVYYRCGEILRDVFYNEDLHWEIDKCRRHSIFISQAGYAIKGFHLILEALKELFELYPDLHVYVAGSDIWTLDTSYAYYIRKKIEQYKLNGVIEFVGCLQKEDMVEHYLKANVFLSPSVIENSSNSICEALHIGVPVVSSCVGGTTSIIEHGKSGFLYPLDESYMAAYYVKSIFDSKELAETISCGEQEKAETLNGKEAILQEVVHIYQSIAGGIGDGK